VQKIRAAVLREHNAPLVLEDLELEGPHPSEVLVKLASASICHTDLGGIEGQYPSPLPVVLGHEGAGVVEEVGEGVTKVRPGDHVVASVVVHCDRCASCYAGRYYACERFNDIAFGGSLPGGGRRLSSSSSSSSSSGEKEKRAVNHFFAQSSFATRAVVPENIAVPIAQDLPLERMSPLSCGVQTGAGAAINSGVAPGSSFAIYGCGGVGLSAVMGARVVGASEVVAVDVVEERLALALELGATATVNAGKTSDLAAEVKKRVADGRTGVDCAIECAGRRETIKQAVLSTRDFGTTLLVGIPPRGTRLDFDFFTLFQRSVKGCVAGYANSAVLVPYLAKLHGQGRLPFEKLSPKTPYPLEDINAALGDMKAGRVIKPLLRL
jgi:aryl-alcohol dehydrogenase